MPYIILHIRGTSALFKLTKYIFEEYEFKKIIFLRKEKEYRSYNNSLISLIKSICYTFKYFQNSKNGKDNVNLQ